MKRVKRKILFYPCKNYVFLFYLIYLKNKKKYSLIYIHENTNKICWRKMEYPVQ